MDYSRDKTRKEISAAGSNKKKVKNKFSLFSFRIFIIVLLVGGFGTVAALIGAYMGIIQNAPVIGDIDNILPDIYTTIIYDKTGNEVDRLIAKENREYVTFDKIPQDLKDAFVAIEDERFYTHNGVDIKGIFRAVYVTLTSDKSQGASTITQQLIKNIRGITKNDMETKIQEQYLAVNYEENLIKKLGTKEKAKDHILEVYVNTIGLHHGLNGVQTASNFYFGKDVSELNLSECATIAGITQNPSKYTPLNRPQDNEVRRKMVLDKMLELEMITQAEYDEAMADTEDLYERINQVERINRQTSYHSYFVDRLITEVSKDLQTKLNISPATANNLVYNGGLQIYMTQDLEMQKIMDDAFKDDSLFPPGDFEIDIQYYFSVKNSITGKVSHYQKDHTVKKESQIQPWVDSVKNEVAGANDEIINERLFPIPQPQAAMVIMDYRTGEVKALTGGRGEKLANQTLNRATDSPRQPGSVFKVLASFAPAIDLGLVTPSTVIDDSPVSYPKFNNWSPKNWYGGFRGPSTVRSAIRDSMNVVTVKNLMNMGIEPAYNYLKNFGFSTLDERDKVPSLALGGITYGVTQLEVTAAYGAIANLGEYNKPIFYTKVLDHNGDILLENTIEPTQVLKKTSAFVLTDMMKDVVTGGGTGGKAAFRKVKMPIAGKTGTTTNTRDLTFVGYTPYYVSGIWLGFDQPKTIKQDHGYHMYLWRSIMETIHKNLPYKDFDSPDSMKFNYVCSASGKLAVSGLCENDVNGSTVKQDVFVAGTQPTSYCNVHLSVSIDTGTGKRATPFCPPEVLGTAVTTYNKDHGYGLEECDVHTTGIPNTDTEAPEYTGDPTMPPEDSPVTTPTYTPTPTTNINIPTPAPVYTPTPTPTPVPSYQPTPELPVVPDNPGTPVQGVDDPLIEE